MVTLSPTPYPDVNEILEILLASARDVLREKFVGIYLYGSLSSGDFEPAASDIDFLVVTKSLLPEATIAALEAMHYQFWNSGLKWAGKLEGSYLPAAHLRRYEKNGIAYPTVNEGRFYLAPQGSDWVIQRHIIRECGLVLAGPDPKSLIDPVEPDEIRAAVMGSLREWWFPLLDDPSWLREHDSPYHAYAILTMCRSLYALEHGEIISKLAAARWAGAKLGRKWTFVIEQSLAVRLGTRGFHLYDEALELIRYTLERAKIMETQS
jgi:hypothetical protein